MSNAPETSRPKQIVVPRGLSNHGLPKTPGLHSPNGSVRSYRFGGASPPLSPRSFLSVFRAEDSPRSVSAPSFGRASSPSPRIPPVPEVYPEVKDDHHTCPACGTCKEAARAADGNKENEHPNETHSSSTAPLTKLAHRIKSVLGPRRKDDAADQKKARHSKQRLQKVESTHWTEM